MTPRELEEFRALRATIRERGTARIWIVLTGLTGWAALAIATAALAALPIATFLPLLVLAVTFEIVFSLHTGVERVGRYIQVFFEDETAGGWEHETMAYGRAFPGSGTDPLFTFYFWLATVFNFIPAVLAQPVPVEWWVVGVVHVLFMARLAVARRQANRQRALDLERFEQLKRGASATSPTQS
jgi:hypothetical protein